MNASSSPDNADTRAELNRLLGRIQSLIGIFFGIALSFTFHEVLSRGEMSWFRETFGVSAAAINLAFTLVMSLYIAMFVYRAVEWSQLVATRGVYLSLDLVSQIGRFIRRILVPFASILFFVTLGAKVNWLYALQCVLLLVVWIVVTSLAAVYLGPGGGVTLASSSYPSFSSERLEKDEQSAKKLILKRRFTDRVTGLEESKIYVSRLNEELERARRYEYPLSIVLLEAVARKETETYCVDYSIKEELDKIAATLKLNVRFTDVPGRPQASRFVVALPGTDLPRARVFAERLTREARRIKTIFAVATGCASSLSSTDSVETLLKAAEGELDSSSDK